MEFTETYISDNRTKVLRCSPNDEIIIGGSSTNLFYFWFNFDEYVQQKVPNSESSEEKIYDCEVIYKQGFEEVLPYHLFVTQSMVDINSDNTSIVTVNLSPEQTSLFKDSVLDTYVQLKMKTIDNLTQYSNPTKLRIFKPLDGDSLV